jgi:hypothetical protein
MTEKQEAQFRKLIEYVRELARQHNEVGDMRTARGDEPGCERCYIYALNDTGGGQ